MNNECKRNTSSIPSCSGWIWLQKLKQVFNSGTIRKGKQIASYGRDSRQLGNGFSRQADRQFDNFNNINNNDISDDMMNIKMLSISVPGIPGIALVLNPNSD